MPVRIRVIFLFLVTSLVSIGLGAGLAMLNNRYDVTTDLGARLAGAVQVFLVPRELAISGPGSGEIFPVDDCLCQRQSWQCPCGSFGREDGLESAALLALAEIPPPVRNGPTTAFRRLLVSATGYERIQAADDPVVTGRISDYAGGMLREFFLKFETPKILVRSLVLTHEVSASRSLFVHTPASWTTAETPLGIGDPMYLRNIGRVVFEAGHDVISFDHGSNGHMETMLNGYSILTAGVQVYGLWARSACDMISRLKSEGRRYDRVVIYGLSRGNRTVEYIRGLCSEVDIALGDDTWEASSYVIPFWRPEVSFVHTTKYGAFFHHVEAFIGQSSALDLMTAAANPKSRMVLFMSGESRDRDWAAIQQSFDIESGASDAAVQIVAKRIQQHVPEAGSILEILSGHAVTAETWSLRPKPMGG